MLVPPTKMTDQAKKWNFTGQELETQYCSFINTIHIIPTAADTSVLYGAIISVHSITLFTY
jgi:hypothetical protein